MKISEIAKLCAKQTEEINNASPEQKAKWAEESRKPLKLTPEDEECIRQVNAHESFNQGRRGR